jgi:hypothetical protein
VRQVYFIALAAVASLAIACAGARPEPAKPPPVDPETRLDAPRRPRGQQVPPRIQAPPPAYGNKIVMAEAPAAKTEM